MFKEPSVESRKFVSERIDCDLVVVGGSIAGVCCAITAARAGIKITLIQDRAGRRLCLRCGVIRWDYGVMQAGCLRSQGSDLNVRHSALTPQYL